MNELIKIVLSLSVSGTLLLLLVWGLKPLYKNKFSRRWQYYVWIIVVLRFLLPFAPDTTIVGKLFEKVDTTAMKNEVPANPNALISINDDNSTTDLIQTDKDITVTAMRKPFQINICIFVIWLVLALVLFVRKIMVYRGFMQYIKMGKTELSDIKILNLLSDCKEKLNIKTKVVLFCHSRISSPMMIGFFRPVIVLPVGELEDKDISYVFMHELTHYKQRDMFYKWLIQIVVCIHWFNPFVYLLEKEVNQSCELSCDEAVISMLDGKARREYGDMLISFVRSNNVNKSAFVSVTLTEGAAQLKERLGAIMKFKRKSKSVIALTTICTVTFCLCFLATGAYAAPSASSNNTVWKDRYTSIGSFSDLDTANTIENNSRYTYVHNVYYSDSYIIGMGWNLNDTIMRKEYYTGSIEITLEDKSTIFVYFGDLFFGDADGNAADYLNDNDAISAVGKLIYSLKKRNIPNYPALETPLVTSITYVGKNLPALAEEYFDSNDLVGFSAIFPVLDAELQREYCQKIYDNNEIAYFSRVIPYMDRDSIMLYADQADQDMRLDFFSVILRYMQSDDLDQYAAKYYEADNIARFAVMVPYMTESGKQAWLIKAQADQKNTFSAVLSNSMP